MNKVKKAFYRAGCIAMQALYAVGRFFKKLWQHKQGRIGLIIVAFLALLAIFAPLIAPYDPYDVTQRADKGLLPSSAGWIPSSCASSTCSWSSPRCPSSSS